MALLRWGWSSIGHRVPTSHYQTSCRGVHSLQNIPSSSILKYKLKMGELEIVDQIISDDDHCSSSDDSYSVINQRANDDENESDSSTESDALSDEMDLFINSAADNQINESENLLIAEDLRQNLEIIASKTQLATECRCLTNPTTMAHCERQNNRVHFNESTTNTDKQFKGLLAINWQLIGFCCFFMALLYINQDLKDQIRTLASRKTTNVVPVFSVTYAKGYDPKNKFYSFEFDTKTEHGDFDIKTGIFTVKTLYQFNFNGHAKMSTRNDRTHHFELRVNDKVKASFYISSKSEADGYQPVDLSALLNLNIGDSVGVFRVAGQLYEHYGSNFFTRFSGILLFSN